MALNIAVPLSGVGGLAPISPIGMECWESIKILVSPIGSESSGVSSLDSEEAKQQLHPSPPKTPEDLKIEYNGRDILDLGANIQTNPKQWNLRYTYLPENNNIPMFLANRSQYHRLGANGHIQEYSLVKCEDCDFQYPINSSSSFFCKTSVNTSTTTNAAMTYTGLTNNNHHYNNSNYNNSIGYNNNALRKAITFTTTITPPLTTPSITASTNFNNIHNNSTNNGTVAAAHKYLQANPTTKSVPNGLNNFYTFISSFNNNNNNNNTNNNNNNNNNSNNNNNNLNNNSSIIANASVICSNNSNNTLTSNFATSMFNGYGNQQNYARMYKYF